MNDRADRFEILRSLAVAGVSGHDLTEATQKALRHAAGLVGLAAGALYLWDEDLNVTFEAIHDTDDTHADRLKSLENDLFSNLRKERDLVSAYMSFGGDNPCHTFTLPIRHGGRVFGAVIGLQEGERTLVAEDAFLEAVTAALALNYAAQGIGTQTHAPDALEKEKLAGIIETAVTVNHEVNSPLTAILGNIQLLLRDQDRLDDDLVTKLRTIEASAERIQRVTHRLLRVTSPRSVEYTEGIRMLDLSEEDES